MSCKNGGQKWECNLFAVLFPKNVKCIESAMKIVPHGGSRRKYSNISNLFAKLQHAKASAS